VLPTNYFGKQQVQTTFFNLFNLAAATLFLIDSLLYHQAYVESRRLHREGHAARDAYDLCVGKIDSAVGVAAYMLNIIGSCGYVATALLSVWGDQKNDVTNQVDLYSAFFNTINMLCYGVSSGLLSYVWFADRHSWEKCAEQAPRDLNFVSQLCDTTGSIAYLAFVLYGVIMRVSIAGDALQHNDARIYPKGAAQVQSTEYSMYLVGDVIYLGAPVVLLCDYYRMKGKQIEKEHIRESNAASDDYKLNNDDLRASLLAAANSSPDYGSHDDAVNLDEQQPEGQQPQPSDADADGDVQGTTGKTDKNNTSNKSKAAQHHGKKSKHRNKR
jgi:hypothetical protein